MNRAPDPLARLDIEWIAIKAGIKPANRLTVAPERADELEARARRAGFAVARSAGIVEFPGRAPSLIMYVSPDATRARELVGVEAALLPPEGNRLHVDDAVPRHAQLGELLGFPRCCIDEFSARLRRGVLRRLDGREAHEDFVAAECAASRSSRLLGRLNDLAPDRRVRIVTFYPCRYDCRTAAHYAACVYAAAERASPTAAAALHAALLGTVSIAVDGGRGSPDQLRGEVLTLTFATF